MKRKRQRKRQSEASHLLADQLPAVRKTFLDRIPDPASWQPNPEGSDQGLGE